MADALFPHVTVEPTAVCDLGMTRDGVPVPAILACVHKDALAMLTPHAAAFLHPEEFARWSNFPAPRRRESYLMGRFAAKRALGVLRPDVAPHTIAITPGVFGQPVVHVPSIDPPAVSLSHTADVAVAASCEREHIIGIDVETLSPGPYEVLASVSAPAERHAVAAAFGDAALAATVLWCLKEALSKALRCGLTTPFELLGIADPVSGAGPGREMSCTFTNFGQYAGRAWVLDGHVIAIAYPRRSKLRPGRAALGQVDRALAGGHQDSSAGAAIGLTQT